MSADRQRDPEQGEDPLAYGEYPQTSQAQTGKDDQYEGPGEEGERGIIGDTYRKFRGKPPKKPGESHGLGTFLFDKLHDAVHDIGSEIEKHADKKGKHSRPGDPQTDGITESSHNHRFDSFAGQRMGNDVKWYVDGCGYFWAVSLALEKATQSIWILDWWLSPELYLRRPPSTNEKYRLDRMLQAAAERGVKVSVIVYKEVPQALSLDSKHTKHALESLHPNIAVFRHPDHAPDAQTLQSSFMSSLQNISLSAKTASTLPQDALKAIYGMNDDVILYWAHHEKLLITDGECAFMGGLDLCYGRWDTYQHPLADCHPTNLDEIVFPGQDYNNARIMDFQDVSHWQQNKLDRRYSSRMGWSDCSVNLQGPVVEDLRNHFVQRWNFIYNEKYDVRSDKRYSGLSLIANQVGNPGSVNPSQSSGPYQAYHPPPPQPPPGSTEAYGGYPPPPSGPPPANQAEMPQGYTQYQPPPSQAPANVGQTPYFPPPPGPSSREVDEAQDDSQSRGISTPASHHHGTHHYEQQAGEEARRLEQQLRGRAQEGKQYLQERYLSSDHVPGMLKNRLTGNGMQCQIARSCTKWSHGVPTEHSIANAYISVIENSRHFIYIENQFFITATSDEQKPVKNKIGAAIVDRILRAARAAEKFKVIVVIPAIPGFAGDLKNDASLGTRAIMEFQYNSINRGGHSIMECVANAGYDPTQYIRFYNLRNYDRIDVGGPMSEAQKMSGVSYEQARREHDEAIELPADQPGQVPAELPGDMFAGKQEYQAYQNAASQMNKQQGLFTGEWDSVSECYMLNGRDLRTVPWDNGVMPELDAFVSEELYVHTKVLIADDRVVICGSANLNDRSQLGYHDSEIVIVVEDPAPLDSSMNGQPYRASKFAATLRRQLFRKHLGLLPAQNMMQPDGNFQMAEVPNSYDYGSPEDRAVMDPLADTFLAFWNTRARNNTQIFSKVFHAVPDDSVRTWDDYDKFYEHFFKDAGEQAEGKDELKRPSKYMWGHVVAEEFSPGDQGCKEVKDMLSQVKGTLVEMPLLFLIKEDIAKEGLTLNAFTEEVYT